MKKHIIHSLGIIFLLSHLLACRQNQGAAPAKAQAVTISDTVSMKMDSISDVFSELMQKYDVPGVSLALIKNGELESTRQYGVIQAGHAAVVDGETMFSVGSISKVVAAMLTLQLVREGKLDLDADVNQYLTKWKVPASKFTKDHPVTLRKIMSHTAGFTVHGFADYLPEEATPNTVEILKGTGPAKNDKVVVHFPVGSQFKYSGGGITVQQLIIEEITGLPYYEAAHRLLFKPTGLKRTSYQNPLPGVFGNIAKAHDKTGKAVALPRGYQTMPEVAASGLWTTPSDLAVLLTALLDAYHQDNAPFLPQALVRDMLSSEPESLFGLGPKIEYLGADTIFYHNGANDSYRGHFKVLANRQSGYILFANGTNGLDLFREVMPLLDRWATE